MPYRKVIVHFTLYIAFDRIAHAASPHRLYVLLVHISCAARQLGLVATRVEQQSAYFPSRVLPRIKLSRHSCLRETCCYRRISAWNTSADAHVPIVDRFFQEVLLAWESRLASFLASVDGAVKAKGIRDTLDTVGGVDVLDQSNLVASG